MLKSHLLYVYTHTLVPHWGLERERDKVYISDSQQEALSSRPCWAERLCPQGPKRSIYTSCLTIIIIQKGLLFIWLPSSTQSWCISQGLSDLASPQLCSTTSSRLVPAPSARIIRRRRSPHSTLISFSTRSPCRINWFHFVWLWQPCLLCNEM